MAQLGTLDNADALKSARLARGKANVEEAHLKGARVMVAQASTDLSEISVARFGAARQLINGIKSKAKQHDVGEGGKKLPKRKLPAPMDSWKDPKGVTMHVFTDRHCIYRHEANIFKIRGLG